MPAEKRPGGHRLRVFVVGIHQPGRHEVEAYDSGAFVCRECHGRRRRCGTTRSRLLGLASPVFFGFLCAGVVALPARATDHFNLESGIPTTLEDIEPIDRGNVELQAFGRFLEMRGGVHGGESEPRVALGVLEDTQLEISTPLLLGEGAGSGNGDVQMSVLRKLWNDPRDRWWPGFAVEADIRLPTGRGSGNRAGVGITALLKKIVGNQHFHLNAGFERSGDEGDEEVLRRGAFSVAAGHHTALTPSIVLVSDLAWRQADDRKAEDIWLLESGVRAQLASGFIGAVGLGAGLNRGSETPVFTVTVGVQIGL